MADEVICFGGGSRDCDHGDGGSSGGAGEDGGGSHGDEFGCGGEG